MNEALRAVLTLLRTFQSLDRPYDVTEWANYIPEEHNVSYENAIAYIENYLEEHAGGYGDTI